MTDSLTVTVAGITLRLLAWRGIYWADQRTLFVADTHLGKEATFRRHSIPIPRGSSGDTLSLIADMLSMTGARRLVILGDMFHARSSLSADLSDELSKFFDAQRHVQIRLVLGNHDRGVDKLIDHWPIEIVTPGTRLGPTVLQHEPKVVPEDASLMLCGHVHPAVKVGSSVDQVRLPCFWLTQNRLVLPALGKFTGGHTIRPNSSDRTWVVAENRVMELPSAPVAAQR